MEQCLLYADPVLYDLLFPNAGEEDSADRARAQRIAASEKFYVDQARQIGGPILELACGTGRLTIPIAKSGVPITGVDLSASMLDTARTKAAATGVPIDFLQGDMRSFHLDRRFAAVFITGNSLLHLLTLADLKSCLRNVANHLAPGGRLVFDISKWDLAQLAQVDAGRQAVLTLNDPQRGNILIEETATYDAATQVRRMVWYLSTNSPSDFRIIEYSLRVIFPEELLLLLENTGFHLDVRYGEFTLDPFCSTSPRQICICSAMP